MRSSQRNLAVLVALTAVCTAVGEIGDGLRLARFTIDDGGAMFSTGGDYELSGTIGQPDAGQMSGDAMTLTGGFWFGSPSGDCDADGAVTLFDFADLSGDCLLGPMNAAGAADCDCFDFDNDGDVDLMDFSDFARQFAE